MAAVGRIFMIFLGYALACVAASTVFTLGMLGPHWDDATAAGLPPEAVWAIVAVGALIVGAIAFLPAALIVALAEGFGWRSVIAYGLAGGALALLLSYGFDLRGDVAESATYFPREREILAASGVAGGLVYWLFAGRRAGAWT
jgi:hypothetical protein